MSRGKGTSSDAAAPRHLPLPGEGFWGNEVTMPRKGAEETWVGWVGTKKR